MSVRQIRVVDPVLSNVTIGYRNAQLVGDTLSPRVPVTVRGGKVIEFDRKAFRLVNSLRAPGGNTQTVDIGFQGKAYALNQHSLGGKVPVEHLEEARNGPGIDMGIQAVTTVMDMLLLGAEHAQATLTRTAGNYPNGHVLDLSAQGQKQWDDDTKNPIVDINAGREVVRSKIGRYPNTLLLGPMAFNAATNNPLVMEKIKYTQSDSITAEMLARQWKLEKVIVGEAIYTDDADVSHDVWGNDAILAYVPKGASLYTPSFCYTYMLKGQPMTEQAYYDESKKSWIYPVTYEYQANMVGPDAGYLIQNAA